LWAGICSALPGTIKPSDICRLQPSTLFQNCSDLSAGRRMCAVPLMEKAVVDTPYGCLVNHGLAEDHAPVHAEALLQIVFFLGETAESRVS
jgi:hypothetical protein